MKFKEWIKMLKFKHIAHKHTVTYKGQCYIHYIINKYINCTKPEDYIEEYEKMITSREAQTRSIKVFEPVYIKEDGTCDEEMLHFLASIVALAMILISLRKEEVNYYLSLIENQEAKTILKKMAYPDKTIKEIDHGKV